MLHEIFNVITGGEMCTCAGQDHCSDGEITGCLIERTSKIGIHIPRERIHFLRAVKGEREDASGGSLCDVTHE